MNAYTRSRVSFPEKENKKSGLGTNGSIMALALWLDIVLQLLIKYSLCRIDALAFIRLPRRVFEWDRECDGDFGFFRPRCGGDPISFI